MKQEKITNRGLFLPYAAPFLAYVFIASALSDHMPAELNYILRVIVCVATLAWAWKWYISLRGPKSIVGSVSLGIVAGWIGVVLWILLLTPFSASGVKDDWSITAFTLRLLAAGLLVPIFEELLMRGFVFRLALQWGEARRLKKRNPLQFSLDEKDINDVSPGAWSWTAVIISALVFASGHHVYEWPAAITFGFFMAFLWILRKDLIVCIVAHSVTNISLAIYVLQTDSWHLW